MKKYIILTTLTAFLALFNACQKEIEFDKELVKPKLVVNGFITPDSVVYITVGLSKTIPGFEKPFQWIDDAKVTLFVDGDKAEELTVYNIVYEENENENNYWYGSPPVRPTCGYQTNSSIIEAGKTYKIEVSHPLHGIASSETTIPYPIDIISVNSATTVESNSYNDMKQIILSLKIRFKDLPNEKNYYRVTLERVIGLSTKYEYYYYGPGKEEDDSLDYIVINKIGSGNSLYSNDPVLTGGDDANDFLFGSPSNNYNVFTDDLIEGKEYELNLNALSRNSADNKTNFLFETGEFYQLTVRLSTLTREAFLYMKSTNAQRWYDEDFFSEPTQVYSNIQNGVGIFAGYSVATKVISEGEYPIDSIRYKEIENNYYYY